jgi:hypothetical protein
MEMMLAKKVISDYDAEFLRATQLKEDSYKKLITSDCDVFTEAGKLLLKFRKNVIPIELLRTGYIAFRNSIEFTESRGSASGYSGKRIRKDGSVSNITVGKKVHSGAAGYLDPAAMIPYCRKTAFTAEYFDRFKTGIPFVECVDKFYEELCPVHYKKQKNISDGTNRNYVIGNTAFTTITVNKNFQTAVHKDTGDFKDGFGNLIVYREGKYDGCYFCLPQYEIAVDMQNTDILFVDVHQWHGNTPFINPSADYLRISFVLYYREYMYQCSQPSKELHNIKMKKGGYNTL